MADQGNPNAGGPSETGGTSAIVVLILYIVAFFFFFIGIIMGLIFLMGNTPEKKGLGRNLIVISIFGAILYMVCYFFYWATFWAFFT